MSAPSPEDPGFGVYVHWPFCAAKCPYCDFNSHVRQSRIDEPRFAKAFAREIAHQAQMAPGRVVTSIFLGGGTPARMQPATGAALLDALASTLHWYVGRAPPLPDAWRSAQKAGFGVLLVHGGLLTPEERTTLHDALLPLASPPTSYPDGVDAWALGAAP